MLLEMGRSWEAVCALHEALAVGPQDPIATDLLSRALEENASLQGWGGAMEAENDEDKEFEKILAGRRQGPVGRSSRRKDKGKQRASEVEEDSMMILSDGEY